MWLQVICRLNWWSTSVTEVWPLFCRTVDTWRDQTSLLLTSPSFPASPTPSVFSRSSDRFHYRLSELYFYTNGDTLPLFFFFLIFFFRLSKERYPKLAAYYDSLKERPSIKASWPPHWLETSGSDLLKDVWDASNDKSDKMSQSGRKKSRSFQSCDWL